MSVRSIPLEQKAIGIFQKQRGKLPQTPDEWNVVHRLAYPGGLPDELVKPKESFAAATDTPVAAPPPVPSLPQDVAGSDLGTMKAGVDAAKAKAGALSQPNEAMRILQEAVRAKSGTAEAPLGESAVFAKAGVGGYGALAQSLASRDKEITTNFANFQNAITTMAGTYRDMASAALANYKAAADEYAAEKERLQGILDKQDRHAEEIELLRMRADIDERLKRTPSFSERLAADEAGYEIRGGSLVPAGQGVVSGFDITTYATDPMHEARVAGIVQGIGKFDDVAEMDAYIRRKYPNSPVTGEMVSKASQKYGVPWEIMVAMMEQDSSMGTAGKGARTFNPGNLGNDDAGNIRNYGNWQAGVDAVASWLDRHRAAGTTAKPPAPKKAPETKTIDGVTKEWNPETGVWQDPSGIAPDAAMAQEAAAMAQAKVDSIDELITSRGLSGSVGSYWFSRWTPFKADKADRQDFAAGVNQLVSKDTLDTLLALKAQGGTLGALSDGERVTLQQSATKIGSWMMRDKNGNPTGEFGISEELFLKEIRKMREIAQRALDRAAGKSAPPPGKRPADPLGLKAGSASESSDPAGLGI